MIVVCDVITLKLQNFESQHHPVMFIDKYICTSTVRLQSPLLKYFISKMNSKLKLNLDWYFVSMSINRNLLDFSKNSGFQLKQIPEWVQLGNCGLQCKQQVLGETAQMDTVDGS